MTRSGDASFGKAGMVITDDEIQKALDFLWEGAATAAEAKSNRVYLEEYRKSLKAILMKENEEDGKPIAAQERDAYRSEKYRELLAALKEAVFHDEKQRFLRQAELAKLDIWRTLNANERAARP